MRQYLINASSRHHIAAQKQGDKNFHHQAQTCRLAWLVPLRRKVCS
jgi:hypothetical protein